MHVGDAKRNMKRWARYKTMVPAAVYVYLIVRILHNWRKYDMVSGCRNKLDMAFGHILTEVDDADGGAPRSGTGGRPCARRGR